MREDHLKEGRRRMIFLANRLYVLYETKPEVREMIGVKWGMILVGLKNDGTWRKRCSDWRFPRRMNQLSTGAAFQPSINMLSTSQNNAIFLL